MLTLMLIALVAQAGDHHSGIPAGALAVLGEAVFLEPGWTAPILDSHGGNVRVFVGAEARQAEGWFKEQMRNFNTAPPLPMGTSEARGNGHSFAAFREHNVAVLVRRPGGGALDLAGRLLATLEDDVPSPQSPMIHVDGLHVTVDGMWANIAVRPAAAVHPQTLMPSPIQVIPTGPNAVMLGQPAKRVKVVVWDRYGRTASSMWVPKPPKPPEETP